MLPNRCATLLSVLLGSFALSSCDESGSGDGRSISPMEAVTIGKEIVESQYWADVELIKWLEKFKDAESAKAAMDDFGPVQARYDACHGLMEKYGELEFDPDQARSVENHQNEMREGLDERKEAAMVAAMDAIGEDRELLQALIDKMALLGE